MQVNRNWIFILILLGVMAALYGQFLHNPIVFDDVSFFIMGSDGHSDIEKFANPSWLDLRVLPYATLAWNAQLFGLGLPPFRIENLLLHWLVVAVLALFVLRLYRTVLPNTASDDERTGMVAAVLIVTSLFALHPVAVYAVGYLVQRSIVMATLFGVLALTAYLRGSNKDSKAWLWSSVGLYLLATHSKEHVIMLPFVVVAMTVLVHEDWRVRLRQNWPVFAGFTVVALLTVAQIRGVIGHAYEINSAEMLDGVMPENAYFFSVMTQSWLFFKYGLLWLLPNPGWMSVDMREPFAQGFFSIYGAALLAWLLYGVLAIRLLFKRGKVGLVGFALLFPWLMFATEFSSVRIQEIFVLYRSYIWALGGVILLPLLLMQLNSRLTIMLSVLVAATLFMLSMERLSTFSNPLLLWDDAEKLVVDRQSLPGVGRIYFNRGTEYLNAGMPDKALPDLQKATRLSPQLSAAFGHLGNAYANTARYDLAIQAYSRAIALDQQHMSPQDFRYYYNRAMAFEATGQTMEATVDFKVSCMLNGKWGCDKNISMTPRKNNN